MSREATAVLLGIMLWVFGGVVGYEVGKAAWKDHDAWDAGYGAGCYSHVGELAGGNHDCSVRHVLVGTGEHENETGVAEGCACP